MIFVNGLNRVNQTLRSPLLILAMSYLGFCLSTVQPKDLQVPNTCLTVPAKLLAIDFSYITLAIFLICSKVRLPLWLTFLTFFLSRSQFPSSLIRRADELGWTVMVAALFWHLSSTMTRIPFHLLPSLTMSSPTFLAFWIKI